MSKERLVECIPNVSEGCDSRVLSQLVRSLEGFSQVALLDLHRDPDHHRSVFTVVGEAPVMEDALLAFVAEVKGLVDIRRHHGHHPRVGIVDVLPLVPMGGMTQEDCIHMGRALGRRIGNELEIPVFFYEAASQNSDRFRLEEIRRGGIESLRHRMETDASWKPDFGPDRLHPTAGALALGVRFFLIAFNVVLQSSDIQVADRIAKKVRTSGGGLPALKAIGVELSSRHLVQVSMNLTDYRITSLADAFWAVEQEAVRHGVKVAESEVVGLIPEKAWEEGLDSTLKIQNWNPDQILETRLQQKYLFSQ